MEKKFFTSKEEKRIFSKISSKEKEIMKIERYKESICVKLKPLELKAPEKQLK